MKHLNTLMLLIYFIAIPLLGQTQKNISDKFYNISKRMRDICYEMNQVPSPGRLDLSLLMSQERLSFENGLKLTALRIDHLGMDVFTLRRLKKHRVKDEILLGLYRSEFADTQKAIKEERAFLSRIASRAFGLSALEEESISLLSEAEEAVGDGEKNLGF